MILVGMMMVTNLLLILNMMILVWIVMMLIIFVIVMLVITRILRMVFDIVSAKTFTNWNLAGTYEYEGVDDVGALLAMIFGSDWVGLTNSLILPLTKWSLAGPGAAGNFKMIPNQLPTGIDIDDFKWHKYQQN